MAASFAVSMPNRAYRARDRGLALMVSAGYRATWDTAQHATVFAEITENTENTENTLQALTGIMDPSQDGYHDTSIGADTAQPATMWDLTNTLENARWHIDGVSSLPQRPA
jgi:hypothetical protein